MISATLNRMLLTITHRVSRRAVPRKPASPAAAAAGEASAPRARKRAGWPGTAFRALIIADQPPRRQKVRWVYATALTQAFEQTRTYRRFGLRPVVVDICALFGETRRTAHKQETPDLWVVYGEGGDGRQTPILETECKTVAEHVARVLTSLWPCPGSPANEDCGVVLQSRTPEMGSPQARQACSSLSMTS